MLNCPGSDKEEGYRLFSFVKSSPPRARVKVSYHHYGYDRWSAVYPERAKRLAGRTICPISAAG